MPTLPASEASPPSLTASTRAPKRFALRLDLRPPNDHELLHPGFRLQPVAATPPRRVARVGLLADEPSGPVRGRPRGALRLRRRFRDFTVGCRGWSRLDEHPLAPLRQGRSMSGSPSTSSTSTRTGRAGRSPAASRRRLRSALLGPSAHTSPSSTQSGLHGLHDRPRDRIEAGGERVPVAARELGSPAGDRDDCAVAVPLHLVQPLVADRNAIGKRREHRPVHARLLRRRFRLFFPDDQPVLRVGLTGYTHTNAFDHSRFHREIADTAAQQPPSPAGTCHRDAPPQDCGAR